MTSLHFKQRLFYLKFQINAADTYLFFAHSYLSFYTVKYKYKWRRCLKKKCCKQCRQVKFMGTMAKWPAQKNPICLQHKQNNLRHHRNRNFLNLNVSIIHRVCI